MIVSYFFIENEKELRAYIQSLERELKVTNQMKVSLQEALLESHQQQSVSTMMIKVTLVSLYTHTHTPKFSDCYTYG